MARPASGKEVLVKAKEALAKMALYQSQHNAYIS